MFVGLRTKRVLIADISCGTRVCFNVTLAFSPQDKSAPTIIERRVITPLNARWQ